MVKWVALLVFGRFRVQISARISDNPNEVFFCFHQCSQTKAGILPDFDKSSSAFFPANFLITVIHCCYVASIESVVK
jgi:hypothetical protein